MPVPSQGHYGLHSFPVVDWFCLFIYLWVLTFPLLDCSEFDNFVITIIVFTTILEQNRSNSCQISAKRSEVNVKNTFTSHIDKKKYFWHFFLTSLSLYIFTIWKCIAYKFWLSLCKIVRSSVILLLPLFNSGNHKMSTGTTILKQ
jgi:hypothetical protein